jgi:ribonuclease I
MRRWFLALAILLGATSGASAQVTDHYALLMVWMPGLCKIEPDRVECKDLTLRRFDGLNLAFMALQSVRPVGASNTFCYTMIDDETLDRQRNWCDMYQPKIANTLAVELQTLMPVTRSCQDRGLWARYGSCTMYSADEYYSRAIKLAKSFNNTQLNSKIAAAVGTTAKQSELLDAFKADFGDEKVNAVEFFCRKIGSVSHLLQVRVSVTARALTRGLEKESLWKPQGALRRSCPENIVIDAPPVPIAESDKKSAPPAKPAPPPGEPAVPDAAPVAPVETAPLEPTGPVVR